MYDADAIEAINCEQLVTATDRLLLRGGRPSRRRPSIPSLVPHARGSQPQIIAPFAHAPRGSQPQIIAPFAHAPRGSQPSIAQTAIVRAAKTSRSQAFAISIVIPTLLGIAVGLAAML